MEENSNKDNDMEENSNYDDTELFLRGVLAKAYGVAASDITDEFLKEKDAEADREFARMLRHIEEHGITLHKDTPEHRAHIERKIQKIIGPSVK